MIWILWVTLARAGALVGVDYVPLSRGDLAWISEGQTSGTLVSETDGLLVGPLTAWGGVAGRRNAVLVGLATARRNTVTRLDDQESRQMWAGLRSSVDYRRYLRDRQPGSALGYLQVGTYATVPWAETSLDSATDEEQAALDEAARQDRARIGGMGLRGGAGAELGFGNGLNIGVRYLLVLHRTQDMTEESVTTSTWLRTEGALVLGFDL